MSYRRLIGEKVFLSPLSAKDAEKYSLWLNDFEVMQYMNMAEVVYSVEKEFDVLEKKSMTYEPAFSIIDQETDKLIGSCSIANIDSVNGTAELGVMIGDKNFWGRGYGADAVKLLLDHSFNVLNLKNIMVEVYSYNERAIKCFEKCGFKKIGFRRNSKTLGGETYNTVFMDIVSTEFESVYINNVIEKFKTQDFGSPGLEII